MQYNKTLIQDYLAHITSHNLEIIGSLNRSWEDINFNLNEPDIIKTYLMAKGVGIDYLNQNISKKLSNGRYEFKFASVFIHQKPRITRTEKCSLEGLPQNKKYKTKECELGDMLTIFCLLDNEKLPIYTSSFISQVKKEVKIDNPNQQCLYDSDETFLISASLEKERSVGNIRKFPNYSEGRNGALNYLILGNDNFDRPFFIPLPFDSILSKRFSSELYALMTFLIGKPFNLQNSQSIEWDGLMLDLIRIGVKAKVSNNTKFRGTALEELVSQFNDFKDFHEYSYEIDKENDDEGLPIMLIIVKDKEAKL